jgi:hypothetical protein
MRCFFGRAGIAAAEEMPGLLDEEAVAKSGQTFENRKAEFDSTRSRCGSYQDGDPISGDYGGDVPDGSYPYFREAVALGARQALSRGLDD